MRVEEELARFQSDVDYIDQHYEELLAQHAEQWVGVYDGRVVGAASTMEELVAQLRREGLDPGRVACEYLTTKEETLIL